MFSDTILNELGFAIEQKNARIEELEIQLRQAAVSAAPMTLNLADNEAWLINKAMQKSHGNIREAAKLLGISERTLHRKLK